MPRSIELSRLYLVSRYDDVCPGADLCVFELLSGLCDLSWFYDMLWLPHLRRSGHLSGICNLHRLYHMRRDRDMRR